MYYNAQGVNLLYSKEQEQWYFTRADEDGRLKHDGKLLHRAEMAEILTCSQWRGHIKIELSRPLHTKEEIKGKIDALLIDITERIKKWDTDLNERAGSVHGSFSFTVAAQPLFELVELLQEAVMLISQAKGHSTINGWFVPFGFLETTKKTVLKYLSLSCISKNLMSLA